MFVFWEGGGNVNPFLALAEQLRARGDRVVALATASMAGRLGAADVAVSAIVPDGWLPSASEVTAAIDLEAPDALVVDYMLTGALCAAEKSGLPTAALVHTLYTDLLEDGAPNPIAMAGSIETVNRVRTDLGLQRAQRYGDLLDACHLVLVTAPAELDAPGETPANVHHVGGLFPAPGSDEGWEPPPGDAPLVVISAGTAGSPEQEGALLQLIFDALAPLDTRGFATVPGYLDADQLSAPPHVSVAPYVRHPAVLPHADLFVTHAGLGSVVAGLAYGVPMVCLPLDREQPNNARAVERIGAGLVANPNGSATELREVITTALADSPRVRIPPDPAVAIGLIDQLV